VTETELMRRFLARVTAPDMRMFRRNVGAIETNHGGVFRSGVPGQCDVYGFARGGYAFEIEFKAATGKLSEAQLRWRQFCESWGIPWLLLQARRGEDLETTLTRWEREFRDFAGGIRGRGRTGETRPSNE
jgi:hypothetical protein